MARKTLICTHCGQPLVIPLELQHLHIRPKEILILHYLIKRQSTLITYETLYKEFNIKEEALKTNLSRIRSALTDSQDKWRIVTVYGEGLMLLEKEAKNQ